MSLINEALKKAQRQRNEGQATDAPPTPGGASIAKRGPGKSPQTVLLLGGGALALVIASVGTTVWLVNRKPDTPVATSPTAATSGAGTAAPAASAPALPLVGKETAPATGDLRNPTLASGSSPSPATQLATGEVKQSGLTAATPASSSATSATPASTTQAPAPTGSSVASTTAATSPATLTPPGDAAAAPTPAPAAASTDTAGASGKLEDRILAFVDAARVAGVRTSGGDSRVLMNDRVYRVNDLVNRSLGLRLIKVSADTLTFADASGATYEKTF